MVLNILNKFLSVFLIICFLTTSSYAQTSTSTVGMFSLVKQGEIVKFDGVLFDSSAVAIILTDKEQTKKEFELAFDLEFKQEQSKHSFELKSLQLSFDFQIKTNNEIITIKDKEIKELRDIAINKSDYTLLFIGGGAAGGIILTLLVLFASKKVSL